MVTSNEEKVNILWNQEVHIDRTTPNNELDIIIRDNVKGTCIKIDVAELWDSVMFTVSVKGMKHHSLNREMFGNELLRLCCVFAELKI
jgi:hypothetical protein